MPPLRFPEYYYGGPYLRVENPDTDLPRRAEGSQVNDTVRSNVERHGTFDGERIIAPFGDGNTLDEITGSLLLAADYPSGWDDDERFVYPTIQGSLAECVDRLREKASRARGPKANWLKEAITVVLAAAEAFRQGDYVQGEEAALEAMEFAEAANRVKRRRTAISLGPRDGDS